MSGKTSQIEFLKLFDLFENPAVDQFIEIDKLLTTHGIYLKFQVKKFNPVNGFFGTPVNSENYDYTGIEHLLNCSDLFINLNNYTNNYTKDEDIMSSYLIYNKISLNESDYLEISFPQTNEVLCLNSTISALRSESLDMSSSLIQKIINDKHLLIKIKKNKTGSSNRNENIKRIVELNDQESFNENLKWTVMKLVNSLKNEKLSDFVRLAFDFNVMELSNLNHDDKLKLMRKKFVGVRNYIWIRGFFYNLGLLENSTTIESKDNFLKKINDQFNSRLEKSKNIILKLKNELPFEVNINHD